MGQSRRQAEASARMIEKKSRQEKMRYSALDENAEEDASQLGNHKARKNQAFKTRLRRLRGKGGTGQDDKSGWYGTHIKAPPSSSIKSNGTPCEKFTLFTHDICMYRKKKSSKLYRSRR